MSILPSVSLNNKNWRVLADSTPQNLEDLFDIILKNRGFSSPLDLAKVTLKNTMPDPFIFKDMRKAVDRIVSAIYSGQPIAIMGDYDVDGISSTVLLMNFFEHLKVSFSYSIPNRSEEGYGLSIDNLKNHKDSLVVAVDCGSSSFEELEYAKDNGIDVIVLDHHTISSDDSIKKSDNSKEILPLAYALVNPHRPDESEEYRHLCAAGVVFVCIVGINAVLREQGFYREHRIREPDLFDYLDLVALATVCDVMPLVGLNRAFVVQGIKTMLRRKNLGIDALINQSKTSEITSDTISFAFGPKINAAGRLAVADLSVKLLSTKNPIEAKKIADQLEDLNKKRQKLELEMVNEAIKQIDKELDFVCVYSKDWHIGIVGIAAGRIKDNFHKPTFVIAIDENGKGRGSCRSIASVDIAVIIHKAVNNGILSAGGGHAMAAGFCIDEAKIPELIEFLRHEIHYSKTPEELEVDCILPASMISLGMLDKIASVGPFGNGNKHPKFVIPNLSIVKTKVVGNNHLQIVFEDERSNLLYAIYFRAAGKPVGTLLQSISSKNKKFQALGTLSVSQWSGKKTISLVIDDIAEESYS